MSFVNLNGIVFNVNFILRRTVMSDLNGIMHIFPNRDCRKSPLRPLQKGNFKEPKYIK